MGTFLPIDVPSASPFNATSSYAFAINSSGLIVGDYTSNNVTHGYLKDATGFHTIDVPSASPFNATSTLPYGINGAGEVVGTFVDTANKTHGYLQDAAGFHAIDVPNAASTEAYRVNQSTANGSKIVGDYTDNSGKTHGFYTADKGTTFKTIDIPNADTELYGINNAGKIVGIYDGANNTIHSFLTTDLGSTFTEFNFSTSASKTFANDINNYDTIVGSYRYPTSIDFHGFIADPPSSAPEPSTLALVAAGMASFGLRCLRRRARVRPARGQTEEAALR